MKRFHSVINFRIPRETLYYVDKLVREKIRQEQLKLTDFKEEIDPNLLHKNTFSPKARDNDKMLRETREMLNFMTPIKKSQDRKKNPLSPP